MDHLLALPAGLDAGSQQRRATLPLLALVAAFALPERYGANVAEVEQLLANRFAPANTLSLADIQTWLANAKIPVENLSTLVDAASQGNAEPLHAMLQQHNDAGHLHLLAVSNAGALTSADAPDKPLGGQGQPCLLVRIGYSDSSEQPYGYYYVGLPGISGIQTKIVWASLLASGITTVLAVEPPKPPVDHNLATSALHVMEQAIETAQQAHSSIAAALGVGSAA